MDRLNQWANIAEIEAFFAHLSPHPATQALSNHIATVTEILTIYLPIDYTAADQRILEKNFKKFVSVIEENAPAHTGSALGWAIGEVPIPGTSDKAKAYVTCLGWQSVEAESAFRETQWFKDNEYLLSQIKDLRLVQRAHFSGTLVN